MGDVPHGTTHEDIYGRLKRAIMSAHYLPGERLVVSKLEKVFGTSAMPIREALRRLVAEQALQNNPNRGVEVPQMTAGRLMDLRRVRCEIEGKATEWAALTITKRGTGASARASRPTWSAWPRQAGPGAISTSISISTSRSMRRRARLC